MQAIHRTLTTLTQASRRQRRAMVLATSAVFSLAAAGCGSDNPLAPGMGTGNLTATGAVAASGSGLALFQSVSSGGTSLFQVVIAPLTQGTTTWQLQIANYSGRLEAGTYNLSPLSAGSTTANFYYTTAGAMQMFNSTSGELVITSSSSSAVRGTFTFTATDPAGGASSVTVQGSFNAPCAPGMSCL